MVAVALTPRRKPELSHPQRPSLRLKYPPWRWQRNWLSKAQTKGPGSARKDPPAVPAALHGPPHTHLHHAPHQARYIWRITPCHPVIGLDSDGYAEAEGDNLLCPARPCDGGKLVARRCSTTVPFILSPPNRQVLSQLINYMRLDYMQLSGLALPPPGSGRNGRLPSGRPLHTNAERKVAHGITRLRLGRAPLEEPPARGVEHGSSLLCSARVKH